MRTFSSLLTVVLLLVCAIPAAAQEKEIKHTTAPHTSPTSGKQMFTSYCAVCHGTDGKGSGPAADALKSRPTDLTALAQKNGGKFPAQHVAAVIRGEATPPAHGSKEMPVWGPVFRTMSGGHESEVMLRVSNLTKFIESLQTK